MNSLVNMRVANCIISFYLIITITITITIINTAYFANASISFPYNNRTITRPTFDVFESYYSPYNISGIAYNPSFADNTTCTLLRPDKATRFHNPLTADGVPTFNELVIVLDDDYVRDHGCYTVTQVAIEVQAYGGDLTRYHNYPPTKALLYILKGVYHGVEGAPTIVPYISSSVFIPDDQPPIPVALLSEKYFDEFVDAYDEAGEYIPINLKQELGPWNELFLSNGYRACNTVLVAAGAIIFLSGLRTLLLLIFQGKFSLDPRSIIFIVGLASTLLSTIAIPIRLMCLANYTIVRISTILYSATFYWLLLAWCPVISAVEANRKFPFKMGIIVCYAAQMTVLGIRFILDFVPFNEIVSTAFSVITYINAILQLFTCGIFIYNAVIFRRHLQTWSGCRNTFQSLRKLWIISFTCAFVFLVGFVANLLLLIKSVTLHPEGLLAWAITRNVSALLRSFTLLLVVGVSNRHNSVSGATVNTFRAVRNFFQTYSIKSKTPSSSRLSMSDARPSITMPANAKSTETIRYMV